MKRFLPSVVGLIALVCLLPATVSAQQWGRGLVPGDSIRATTGSVVVHGRFARWSDSTLIMADTTLMRMTIQGFELWRKRDAGQTFALSFAGGVAGGITDYLLTDADERSGRAGISIAIGALATVIGYGLIMITQPGKWITP